MASDDSRVAVPWARKVTTLFLSQILSQKHLPSSSWRLSSLNAKRFGAHAVVLGLLLLVLGACTGQTPRPDGWSGGAIAGDRLFIGTSEGEVLALDRTSGETAWRFELNGPEKDRAIYGAPVVVGDTIYVGGYDSILYALSLDGNLKWQERVGDHIVGSPAVVDGMVVVGASDGNLYAFDAADRSELWKFKTGNKVWTTPTVADGVVYFGSLDHNVYAVRLQGGAKVWQFATKGAVGAPPVVAGGRVYVGSFDGIFYALDAATGEEVWRFEGAGNWYWARPAATADTLYAPSLDGSLYALDANTGDLRWTLKTEGPIIGSPVIISEIIAVPSDDGRIRLARLRDGAELDACNIGQKIRTSLVEQDSWIYFRAQDHSVRALQIKPNGNPDEQWVHLTNKDDPIPRDKAHPC